MPKLFLFVALLLVAAQAASAQAPAAAAWAGWARCQVDVQGPGCTDQQIRTWILTGGTPTVEGAFRVFAGTWSVVGGGSLRRTQGTQTLSAQWATNAQGMSAPIAVFVRASDGRMFIQARHAQLRSAGAVAGYQQQTIDGKAQPPGQIAAEAFEWSFPVVDGAATGTTLSGSSAPVVNGSVGYMQPGGSRGTASCTWQFGQGAAAPAPPPTPTARAIPTPSSVPSQPTPGASAKAGAGDSSAGSAGARGASTASGGAGANGGASGSAGADSSGKTDGSGNAGAGGGAAGSGGGAGR